MFKKAVLCAALAAVGLSAQPALAAGNYLDQLGKIDAQIALVKKEAELRDARLNLAGGGTGLPLIASISGFDERLTATLKYPNGRKINVRKGQILSGGLVIKDVSRAGVVVRVAATDASLEFDAPRDANQPFGSQVQERAPSHLLPPIPQIDVPLPGRVLPSPAPAPTPAVQPSAQPQAAAQPKVN